MVIVQVHAYLRATKKDETVVLSSESRQLNRSIEFCLAVTFRLSAADASKLISPEVLELSMLQHTPYNHEGYKVVRQRR